MNEDDGRSPASQGQATGLRPQPATPSSQSGVLNAAQILAERDFLLARAGHAGNCSFGGERWTGVSSNALVTVAFGGKAGHLPSDSSDLAACYRTILRLPTHLLSGKVLAQAKRGEAWVRSKYPDGVKWAKKATNWPGFAAVRRRAASAMSAGTAETAQQAQGRSPASAAAESRDAQSAETPHV